MVQITPVDATEPRKLAIPKDTRLGPGEHAVRTEGHAILVRLGKLVGSLTDAEGMCAHIGYMGLTKKKLG